MFRLIVFSGPVINLNITDVIYNLKVSVVLNYNRICWRNFCYARVSTVSPSSGLYYNIGFLSNSSTRKLAIDPSRSLRSEKFFCTYSVDGVRIMTHYFGSSMRIHILYNRKEDCFRRYFILTSSLLSTSNLQNISEDPTWQSIEKLRKHYSKIKQSYSRMTYDKDFAKDVPFFPSLDRLTEIQTEEKELNEMKRESTDPEIESIVEDDLRKLSEEYKTIKNEILTQVPSPCQDEAIDEMTMEIRPGVGGEEASLFARDLFNMYSNYCQRMGWSVEPSYDASSMGGLRLGVLDICGRGCYQKMKFEGGIHRVQRVPVTEKGGRIHTSAASVALLPKPENIEIVINSKDITIETMRASGAGGQFVNKIESAVRIRHIPSGVVTECQEGRAQHQNKEIAMRKLKQKLYHIQLEKQYSQIYSQRKLQVGTGGRSEKIRTYNFVQDRITDHRISTTLHNISLMLSGQELLEQLIEKLQLVEKKETLFYLAEASK